MKKRVLSVILALALSLTMFAGIGSAAVNVDRLITAAGNMLEDATDEQMAVLVDVVGQQTAEKVNNDPWAALVDDEINDGAYQLLTDELLKEEGKDDSDKTILPYFMMRYLQENASIAEDSAIGEALAEFAQADADYDTTGQSIRASVNMFDDYADAISAACVKIMDAKDEWNAAFDGKSEDEVNEIIVQYAKDSVIEVAELVRALGFSTSEEEIESEYEALKDNDRAKKDIAIIIGKEALNKMLSVKPSDFSSYVKEHKGEYVKLFNKYRADMFAADKETAVPALYEFTKVLTQELMKTDDEEINELIALLTEKGLTFDKVIEAADYVMNGDQALDDNYRYQDVWYNMALNRVMKAVDVPGGVIGDGDGTIEPEEPVQVILSHRYLERRLGSPLNLAVTDYIYLQPESDRVVILDEDGNDGDVNIVSEFWDCATAEDFDHDEIYVQYADGSYYFYYNPARVPSKVGITVYRNRTDGAPSEDEAVYRYIGTCEFNLLSTKTITLDELEDEYTAGEDTLVAKGTSYGFDNVTVTIVDENGNTVYDEEITAEQLADGYEIPVGSDWEGTYTITIGDDDVTDSATFTVVQPEKPEAKIDITTPDGEEYEQGTTVTVKGTSAGLELITITITDPDGKNYEYRVVKPEEFANGVEYAIAADAKTGTYTITAGNSTVNDSATFVVVESTDKRTIELGALESEYKAGDEVTIKGTSDGFELISVSITRPDGTTFVYAVLTPEEFAAGITYTIPEDAKVGDKYTVTVGDSKLHDTADFTITEEKEAEPTVTLTSPADDSEYKAGDEVTIKGTSEGLELISISITRPDGTTFVYAVLTPEEFAAGITYTIPEDAKVGDKYTVTAGNSTTNDSAAFTIVSGEEPETPTLVSEAYEPTEITDKAIGTAFDELGLPEKVTLTTSDGKTIEVEIDWTAAKAAYDPTNGDTQTLVGTYTIPDGYEANDVVDGKVEVEVTLAPEEGVDLTITEPAVDGTLYSRGDTVTIKGTSEGFELISISVTDPNGETYTYEAITPEEYAANGVSYKLADDALLGTYTITVGNSTFHKTRTFVVTAETIITAETYDPTKISKRRNTAFESLGLPETVTLTLSDGTTIEVEIDWTAAEEEYDKTNLKPQTLVGTYVIPEGYVSAVDEDGNPVADGKVEVVVDLYTSGSGGGGSSSGSSSGTTSKGTGFSNNNGTYGTNGSDETGKYAIGSNGYDEENGRLYVQGSTSYDKLYVTLVGPDGTVLKTVQVTGDEFNNGFEFDLTDLNPLEPGTYTVELRSTENGSVLDSYTFVVREPITVDSFDKVNHMKYIIGYEDGTVRPNANISREEVTTILYRLLTDSAREQWTTESTSKFSDVESDRWSMKSIATLSKAGIVKGYEDGTFAPGQAITRAEFATLVARLAISDNGTIVEGYTDIDGHWAEAEINAVSALGWFEGSDKKFRPDDEITRAEAVTVINRMLERDNVDATSFIEGIAQFSDLEEGEWYYNDMVEATNSHDYTKDEETGKESWTGLKAE